MPTELAEALEVATNERAKGNEAAADMLETLVALAEMRAHELALRERNVLRDGRP
jgi:hypothetical protein